MKAELPITISAYILAVYFILCVIRMNRMWTRWFLRCGHNYNSPLSTGAQTRKCVNVSTLVECTH